MNNPRGLLELYEENMLVLPEDTFRFTVCDPQPRAPSIYQTPLYDFVRRTQDIEFLYVIDVKNPLLPSPHHSSVVLNGFIVPWPPDETEAPCCSDGIRAQLTKHSLTFKLVVPSI